jgi:hypothetical protein
MSYLQRTVDNVWAKFMTDIDFNMASTLPTSQTQQTRKSCISLLKALLSTVATLRHSASNQDRKENDVDDITTDAELFVNVLLNSYYTGKLDLGEALLSQYHSSNLSLADYLRRSSLFNTTATSPNHCQFQQKPLIEGMFKGFLTAYERYIERPIPNTIKPSTHFKPFRDDINIILSYYAAINECVNRLNPAHPTQFDAYFASPSAPNDLDTLSIKGASKWSPQQRGRSRCGLDAIHGLIQRAAGVGCGTRPHKRFVLLIVRKNERDTQDDVLYLFEQELADKASANQRVYAYNEFLWKLHSKQDIVPSKLNVDDCKYGTRYNFLSISYHLHSPKVVHSRDSVSISKNYLYFNGYGQQINKRCILTKWPLLFANGVEQISANIMDELDLMTNPRIHHSDHLRNAKYCQLQSNKNFTLNHSNAAQIGEDAFGLRYQYQSYVKNPKQQTLTFPKEVLQGAVKQTYEFEEQQQLYYYLSWTLKMQLIDGEFLHYTLKHRQPKQVAIFNTELHSRHSQETLYVVAELNDRRDSTHRFQAQHQYSRRDRYQQSKQNKPKWKMIQHGFLTKQQIKNIYDIDEQDLPQGSRSKHGFFQDEISENSRNLRRNSRVQHVRNWNNIERVKSQQYKGEYPRFGDFQSQKSLNAAIKRAVDDVLSGDNQLIPILNIDSNNNRIRCNSLIPFRYKNKWLAASFAISAHQPRRVMIKELYIDVNDIINKAILVDASALADLGWLQTAKPRRCVYSAQRGSRLSSHPTLSLQRTNDSERSNDSNASNATNASNGSTQSNQSRQSYVSTAPSSFATAGVSLLPLSSNSSNASTLPVSSPAIPSSPAMTNNHVVTQEAAFMALQRAYYYQQQMLLLQSASNTNTNTTTAATMSVPNASSSNNNANSISHTLQIPPIQTSTQLPQVPNLGNLANLIPSPQFAAPQSQPIMMPAIMCSVVPVDTLPVTPPSMLTSQYVPVAYAPFAAPPQPFNLNPPSRPITPPMTPPSFFTNNAFASINGLSNRSQ